ncbi:hypothetical protein [Paenibacillus guangzhouensis]|uniref:hypothetical protein n=1 Tax=Paenibacillus guangzhouensis TaxID=1473112 RepID=UPI001266E33C|nr:hypothetical protein [Paenibacillus guangzhouensis]
MTGNIRWNVGFGIAGFAFTFLLSVQNNLLTTSLVRSVYAFLIWFVIAFIIRAILFQLLASKEVAASSTDQGSVDSVGGQLDLVIPDESEELHNMLKPSTPKEQIAVQEGFVPLNPPKIVKLSDQDPEQMAKVIRHLTED